MGAVFYSVFESYFKRALALSLLVHLLFLALTLKQPGFSPPKSFSIDVSLVQEPELKGLPRTKKDQIVTPTDQPKLDLNKQQKESSFLSDRDMSAEREQIKRGDGMDAGPAVGKLTPPQNPSAKVPARVTEQASAEPKKLSGLRLDPKTLSERYGELSQESKKEGSSQKSKEALSSPESSYRPFSRASGSGAAILGEYGSSDYLPDLPDGDITMLNAKANQFAVFVRRVAVQVFARLRASGWESLSASDVLAIHQLGKVRAVLSAAGNLERVEILESSGSAKFDQVVVSAVREGASDRNPPKEALLPNGKIQFIFASRSWVKGSVGRRGAPFERRWLLLGTGLE